MIVIVMTKAAVFEMTTVLAIMTMNMMQMIAAADAAAFDFQGVDGETALHVAFACDNTDCVRLLLSAGAQLAVTDR